MNFKNSPLMKCFVLVLICCAGCSRKPEDSKSEDPRQFIVLKNLAIDDYQEYIPSSGYIYPGCYIDFKVFLPVEKKDWQYETEFLTVQVDNISVEIRTDGAAVTTLDIEAPLTKWGGMDKWSPQLKAWLLVPDEEDKSLWHTYLAEFKARVVKLRGKNPAGQPKKVVPK